MSTPPSPIPTAVFTEFGSHFFDHFAQLIARPELNVQRVVFSAHSAKRLAFFIDGENPWQRAKRIGKLVRYRDHRRARALYWLLRHRDQVEIHRRADPAPIRETGYLCSLGFMRRISPEQIRAAGSSSNLHASLLPEHRGGGPLYWPLREQADHTGVTLHRIDPDIDAGPILLQDRVPIAESDTTDELAPRLRRARIALLDRYLNDRPGFDAAATPQPAGDHRFYPPPRADDLRLDLATDPHDLRGRYRAAGRGRALFALDGQVYAVKCLKPAPHGRPASRRPLHLGYELTLGRKVSA